MDSKRAAMETGDGPDQKRMDIVADRDMPKVPSPGDGSQLNLGKHVVPYTGNGCTPSLEAFLFEATPAGSLLLPCKSLAEGPTSENDAELEKSEINKKPETTKMSRREVAKHRREHTLKALALERELTNRSGQTPESVVLIIRFPDPEISAPMLAGLSKDIRDVVLPTSVAPRYCLAKLKAGVDIDATIREINKVRFGTGFLQAEHKPFSDEEQAEFIDPCSLYVSNIPFNMTTSAIKAYFANAMRVDIGVLKREKRARYAFVRYASPDQTAEAFKELVNSPLNSRTLTVRYRRLRKRAGLPTVQCTGSYQVSSPSADDDNTDCKVVTPPPVESILISDSDNSDSSGDGKGKRRRKNKMTEQEKEIQKLKLQMAEYGAIIKNLQLMQNNLGDSFIPDFTAKLEPCVNPSSCILGSNAVHIMRDIKTECAYLGIPDSGSPVPVMAAKPTSPLPDGNRKRDKSPFRRRKSAKQTADKNEVLRTSPEKDDRLEELYAQLECDPDP
ncbi:protein painting of fourth isoform X2 [Drosophila ficusphila]|uniref:protein painting of fourth isoform X2 n=1 Tax=Drosophila ficusphila TaxID=30025 RepID=UPI0007E7C4A2|nr:protein painting of fourth isoform X2 [Drosophila ficusphila]